MASSQVSTDIFVAINVIGL